MGSGCTGNEPIAYDVERKTFVCARNVKSSNTHTALTEADILLGDDEDDDEEEDDDEPEIRIKISDKEVATHVKQQKRAFMQIPCDKQPVVRINLRGVQLIWGNVLNKKRRYGHCTVCACLHEISWTRWKNYYGPICQDCYNKDVANELPCMYCAFCGPPKIALPQYSLLLLSPSGEKDPNPPYPGWDPMVDATYTEQRFYFCQVHYNLARRYTRLKTKELLWQKIHELSEVRVRRRAMGIY